MSGEYEESEPKPKKQCFICYGSSDTISNPLLDGLCTCKNGLEVAHGKCMAKWLLRYKHKSCEMCHSSYYQKEYFNIDQSDTTSRKGQLRVITNYFLIPVSYHLLIGIIFILFRLIVMPILLAYGWHHLQIRYGISNASHESTSALGNIGMTGAVGAVTNASVWNIEQSQNINGANSLYKELNSVVNNYKINSDLSSYINSSTIDTDTTRMLVDKNTNSTFITSTIASLYEMNYLLAIAVTILAEATFVWWFKFKLAVNKVISKHQAHRKKNKKQTHNNNSITSSTSATSTNTNSNTKSSYTSGSKVERENVDNNHLFSLFNKQTDEYDNVCNSNEELNGTIDKNENSNNTKKNNDEEEKDSEWEDISGENEERGEGEELLEDNDNDDDDNNEDNDEEEEEDNNEEGGDFAMMIHMFSVSNLYKFSE